MLIGNKYLLVITLLLPICITPLSISILQFGRKSLLGIQVTNITYKPIIENRSSVFHPGRLLKTND